MPYTPYLTALAALLPFRANVAYILFDLFFVFAYSTAMRFLRKAYVVPMLLSLLSLSCNYVNRLPDELNSENFFWIDIDDTAITGMYRINRVTLDDVEGNRLATASGPFDGGYKVIPPADYKSDMLYFTVELKTLIPHGEKISMIGNNALARGYLSTRYTTFEEDFPDPGDTVDVVLSLDGLKVGYSEYGILPEDIPDMPDFFYLNLNLTSTAIVNLLANDYAPLFAVAIKHSIDSKPNSLDLDLSTLPPVNDANVLAMASPDTGWFMLSKESTFPLGVNCRYWLFFMVEDKVETSRLYYIDGAIPDKREIITLTPDFAGIPLPDTATLTMLTLNDATRSATPYASLSDTYVLTQRSYSLGISDQWQSIGRDTAATGGTGYSPFTGIFDGGGYKITFFNALYSASPNAGLFGYANGATLRNVRIDTDEEFSISSFVGEECCTGMLVGKASACTINDVEATGLTLKVTRATSGNNIVGTIIGKMNGGSTTNITSQVASVTVTGGTVITNSANQYAIGSGP
jgi:hypothetical protein